MSKTHECVGCGYDYNDCRCSKTKESKPHRFWQCSCNYQTAVVDKQSYDAVVAERDELLEERDQLKAEVEKLTDNRRVDEDIKSSYLAAIEELKAEVEIWQDRLTTALFEKEQLKTEVERLTDKCETLFMKGQEDEHARKVELIDKQIALLEKQRRKHVEVMWLLDGRVQLKGPSDERRNSKAD